MSLHEIDDILWSSVERYLPPQKPHIEVSPKFNKVNKWSFVPVMTGCNWEDLPRINGSN
jgi:transposase